MSDSPSMRQEMHTIRTEGDFGVHESCSSARWSTNPAEASMGSNTPSVESAVIPSFSVPKHGECSEQLDACQNILESAIKFVDEMEDATHLTMKIWAPQERVAQLEQEVMALRKGMMILAQKADAAQGQVGEMRELLLDAQRIAETAVERSAQAEREAAAAGQAVVAILPKTSALPKVEITRWSVSSSKDIPSGGDRADVVKEAGLRQREVVEVSLSETVDLKGWIKSVEGWAKSAGAWASGSWRSQNEGLGSQTRSRPGQVCSKQCFQFLQIFKTGLGPK